MELFKTINHSSSIHTYFWDNVLGVKTLSKKSTDLCNIPVVWNVAALYRLECR